MCKSDTFPQVGNRLITNSQAVHTPSGRQRTGLSRSLPGMPKLYSCVQWPRNTLFKWKSHPNPRRTSVSESDGGNPALVVAPPRLPEFSDDEEISPNSPVTKVHNDMCTSNVKETSQYAIVCAT